MNPFKAIARGITAPVRYVRNTKRLLTLRNEAEDLFLLAEDAEADPRLYRDPSWWARVKKESAELLDVLPMHKGVRMLLKNILANWQTTLTGIGVSFGILFLSALQAGGVTVKDAAIAAGVGVLGALAKDSAKTGTVEAPRTDLPKEPTE